MRLTHYTQMAWDILVKIAKADANNGCIKRHTRADLGIFVSSTLSDDLLRLMVLEGLLISQTGPAGGYSLALLPEEITLAKVIDAVELGGREIGESSPYLAVEKWLRRMMTKVSVADSLGAGTRDNE